MSDYTPTTEEVRSRYVYAADFTVAEEVDAWGELDRWLTAHDAEVRAEVLANMDKWIGASIAAARGEGA